MSANYFIVYNKFGVIEFTTKNRWDANMECSINFEYGFYTKEYYIA